MGIRTGAGPVFEAECLTATRRVQFYSARVFLVVGLLVGLTIVRATESPPNGDFTAAELARFGESFYFTLLGIELVMALMIAPAAASGAICQDRLGGGLALLMTTDLTDREIVLGRLASRLVSTLGVVACGLPVLALATLLGGVDPVAVAGATLVIVGVAWLSVAMALAFSLWAGKPHEALSATYATWWIWILSYLAWNAVLGNPPAWLLWSNPFALIFTTSTSSVDRLPYQVIFLAGCLAGTAALAGLATWRLRPATLHRRPRPAKARRPARPGLGWLRRIGQAPPELDDDPILWREWHRKRPSPFARATWWTYAVLFGAFTLVSPTGQFIAPGVNALQVMIGLLLASIGAATCLAEERTQGGLDVVLATPVDSRRIVLGKWRGAYRVIPRLAILPGLLVFTLGLQRQSLAEALWSTVLVVGLVLAYGAVVIGMGLLIAIHQPRQGRAIALSVGCYLAAAVAYPAVVMPFIGMDRGRTLPLWPSPFFGIFTTTLGVDHRGGFHFEYDVGLAFAFLGLVALVALVLRRVAMGSFDRALGRVADRPEGGGRTHRGGSHDQAPVKAEPASASAHH